MKKKMIALLVIFSPLMSSASALPTHPQRVGVQASENFNWSRMGLYPREQILDSSSPDIKIFGHITPYCSGTLIGPRHVLTAAHCIYHKFNNLFTVQLTFSPGRLNKSDLPFETSDFEKVYLPEAYVNSEYEDNETDALKYDYAVIVLKKPLGDKLGWAGLEVSGEASHPEIEITGYPGDKDYATMWQVRCPTERQSYFWMFKCDSYQGMSGASLTLHKEDGIHIIGVLTHGSSSDTVGLNGGVAFTDEILNQLKGWIADNPNLEGTATYTNPK